MPSPWAKAMAREVEQESRVLRDRAVNLPGGSEPVRAMSQHVEAFVASTLGWPPAARGPATCDWTFPGGCVDAKWTPRPRGQLRMVAVNGHRHDVYVMVRGPEEALELSGWCWGQELSWFTHEPNGARVEVAGWGVLVDQLHPLSELPAWTRP